MKKYLTAYSNVRLHICAALVLAAVLLASDGTARPLATLILMKAAALIIMFGAVSLARRWHREGRFKNLDALCTE